MERKNTEIWSDSSRFADGFRILQGEQEYITYKSKSSIRVWPSEESFHYDRHFHSAIEIVLVLKGEVSIGFNSETVSIQENQLLIIPSEYPHSLYMGKNCKRIIYLFEPVMIMNMRDISYMTTVWSQPIFLNEDCELRKKITECLHRVLHTYTMHEPMWNTVCYSELLMIYALLGQHYIMRAARPVTGPKIDAEIMNSAISYIRQNYMQPLDLDDVAHFVGYSRHYFSRTFKQYTGIPFSNFLTTTRLDVAEEKLVFTELPVQEIAFSCGFSSIATFNRVFKEYKKCTPTQYRIVYSERLRAPRQAVSERAEKSE